MNAYRHPARPQKVVRVPARVPMCTLHRPDRADSRYTSVPQLGPLPLFWWYLQHLVTDHFFWTYQNRIWSYVQVPDRFWIGTMPVHSDVCPDLGICPNPRIVSDICGLCWKSLEQKPGYSGSARAGCLTLVCRNICVVANSSSYSTNTLVQSSRNIMLKLYPTLNNHNLFRTWNF